MDRKKPALTSPWKVGFLVALMLVVTAIGVSYFITGTFGVEWHWISTGGLSPTTWSFHFGAFLEEMAPLLVLTALLAFAAYVLVAGAVRRYKAYVDSGVEYKNLLKSIKSIENLEDESVVEQLKQHPELREFLMGVKHRFARERQNGDRHAAPAAHSPGERRTTGQEERPRLQSETTMLVNAIAGGRSEFAGEFTLTVPELKQIERALRQFFAKQSDATAPPVAPTASDADALRTSLRPVLAAMRQDVEACANGARELESALGTLSTELQSGPAPAPVANSDQIRQRVDATAEALAVLGEETRRVAVAAAMQASATVGPETDAIKLAEALRTLATRFNTVAQHWRQTVPSLNELLAASPAPSKQSGNAGVAATAVTRARLWSERAVAINEHVRALERAVRGAESEPAAPMSEPAATASEPAASPLDVFERTPVAAARPAERSEQVEDFITHGAAENFGDENSGDVSFVDIPGFEKERRFFGDDRTSSAGESRDERFVVDSAQKWDLASTDTDADENKSAVTGASHPAGPDSDGFLTGPRPVVSPKKIERPKPVVASPGFEAPEAAPEAATAMLDPDPDADAVDLYLLGAVDCVQSA